MQPRSKAESLTNGMNDSKHLDIERAETLLRPIMPDKFWVTYDPAMPGSDGKPFRWFQVVFAVGPGDIATLRAQVHELFPKMLVALSPLALVREADHVSLRARRFMPDLGTDRPFMFIQADWTGAAVRQMRDNGDFSVWAKVCLSYRNDHDKQDVLNKWASTVTSHPQGNTAQPRPHKA
jgi:hypothetical protein